MKNYAIIIFAPILFCGVISSVHALPSTAMQCGSNRYVASDRIRLHHGPKIRVSPGMVCEPYGQGTSGNCNTSTHCSLSNSIGTVMTASYFAPDPPNNASLLNTIRQKTGLPFPTTQNITLTPDIYSVCLSRNQAGYIGMEPAYRCVAGLLKSCNSTQCASGSITSCSSQDDGMIVQPIQACSALSVLESFYFVGTSSALAELKGSNPLAGSVGSTSTASNSAANAYLTFGIAALLAAVVGV